MSEENTPEDEFDAIAKAAAESEELPDFEHIMDVVAHYYSKLNPGQHFLRGIMAVVALDEDGDQILVSHSGGNPSHWEVRGILQAMQSDISAMDVITNHIMFDEEDEEDE